MSSKRFPPYHPSNDVAGKLRGATDNQGHFHFVCPKCADNQILQIPDFSIERDNPPKYAIVDRPKARRDFKIAFRLYCPECKFTDFVEIANDGIQGNKTHILTGFFEEPHPYNIST